MSMFINATTRQQISIYSISPYWYLLACTPHIWKSGGRKIFFRSLRSRILFCTPHLKIRGGAHGHSTYSHSAPELSIKLTNFCGKSILYSQKAEHTSRFHLMCLDLAVGRDAKQCEVNIWTNNCSWSTAWCKLQTRHEDLVCFI